MAVPSKSIVNMQSIRFLLNNGISVVILGVVMFMAYQYFELQMENMRKEMDSKLELRKYRLSGQMKATKSEYENVFDVDLTLIEE